MLKYSHALNAIISSKTPRVIFNHLPDMAMVFSRAEAAANKIIKDTAVPPANARDSLKELFTLPPFTPPKTYPITRGRVSKTHGARDDKTPAAKAISGGAPLPEARMDDNTSMHLSIT